jgi:trans-aconitate methyltransferase
MDADLVRRVAERYKTVSARMYARGKLGSDPIAEQLVEIGRAHPFGELVDVGCGRGQMSILVLEAGVATRVVGADWDEPKLAEARVAAASLPATFEKADVRTFTPPPCDTVLLIDVLHYLTDKQQLEVLDHAIQSARRCVIVRELDPGRGLRSATTRVQEAVTTFFGYNVGERVRVLPIASFVLPLERAGFSVEVVPSWGKTPFSNVAVIASR